MPMIQLGVWKNIQRGDPVHQKLLQLVISRQLPEQKKTKGHFTKIKLLHNLFVQGRLILRDGIFFLSTPDGHFKDSVISIPPDLYPGIAHALNIRLDHPSKGQLSALMAKYFYTPGWRSIVEEVSSNCHQCKALRKLPKVLLDHSHTPIPYVGAKFALDVIERESQKILVLRECLSQFTRATIIPNQTAETIRQALIQLIADLLPDTGAEVRADGATSLQSLAKESSEAGSQLSQLKIKIVLVA